MRAFLVLAGVLLTAALGAPGAAVASPAGGDAGAAQSAQRPVYQDGHTGRTLLGGTWRLRVDRGDRGLARHWERSRSTAGWKTVRVPNAYNVGDTTREGLIGWPAWYRKDFTLPAGSRSVAWRLRFEAVNYRATVWLNGRRIGEHAGAFEPFELALAGARPGRVNRLVVRVDNRRLPTDFPPSRYTVTDQPRGGWWNYGGIVREVYLRRVDRIDFDSVQVLPRVSCARCPATVRFRVGVRNDSGQTQRVRLRARFGTLPVSFADRTVRRGRTALLRASVRVRRPHLWSPSDPFLYRVALDASAGSRGQRSTPAAGYRLHSGLRSVDVSADGRLTLNGRPVNLRGVSIHEDLPGKGAALSAEDHAETLARVKDVGATLVRSHYPLHPVFQEMADRNGVVVWSEVPVYQLRDEAMEPAAVRREAVEHLTTNIVANQNHPSVITWSIGNELDERAPRPVRAYVRRRRGRRGVSTRRGRWRWRSPGTRASPVGRATNRST
jgi:beta-glucuronidase